MARPVYEFLEGFAKKSDYDFFKRSAERVREFNFVARGVHEYTDAAIARQKSFVHEELVVELMNDGIKAESRTLTIDALCDIFVVATYWDFLMDLHATMEAGLPYSYKDAVELAITSSNDSLHVGLSHRDTLSDNVYYMLDGLEKDWAESVVRSCVQILQSSNFNHQAALDQVLSSNESKIPEVEEFIKGFDASSMTLEEMLVAESKEIEKRNNGRYNGVSGMLFGGRVVFKDGNGKIMKPHTFFEPDFAGL